MVEFIDLLKTLQSLMDSLSPENVLAHLEDKLQAANEVEREIMIKVMSVN